MNRLAQIKTLFFILLTSTLLVACDKEDDMHKTKVQESNEKLAAYIAENNITVSPTKSGLYFIEIKRGNGIKPTRRVKVKVHYEGWLLDGTKFDSSVDRGTPFTFTLGAGQVIPGWDEGVALMEEGGEAKLILPQDLGYGNRATGNIPAYSPLVFQVKLIEILN